MKSVTWLLLSSVIGVLSSNAEDWRKVAFIGDAEVKSISGVVELVNGTERILREKETATVGHTLRIWRGSEVVLVMKNTKSLVRAKGPCLLRLAPDKDGAYQRADLKWEEPKSGFVVRAVRGGGKYQDGEYWRTLEAGMNIPEATRVRPYRDSVLDFYHPATRTAYRVTDHKRQTLLVAKPADEQTGGAPILAATNP
jgi:hypothetical protein